VQEGLAGLPVVARFRVREHDLNAVIGFDQRQQVEQPGAGNRVRNQHQNGFRATPRGVVPVGAPDGTAHPSCLVHVFLPRCPKTVIRLRRAVENRVWPAAPQLDNGSTKIVILGQLRL
jgi:hypothetical protein